MQTARDYAEGDRLVVNGRRLFMSGMSIAWTSNAAFGNEVGDTDIDIEGFTRHIANIKGAGGNAARWWLHTDASNCPKMTKEGEVIGLGSKTVQNIRLALDAAHEHGVALALCLFSADLLSTGENCKGGDLSPNFTLEGNYKFLTEPDRVDTYIANGLSPMLDALGGHPAIMCWEVFNEAEGMLAEECWPHVDKKITFNDILRVTNRIAGAIRRHPRNRKMVTTGVKDFTYIKAGGGKRGYSDAALIEAGGDDEGWLDFYMPHYRPWEHGREHSPFCNPASYWGADRPIVIGALPSWNWPRTVGPAMRVVDAYEYAYDNGYAGAFSWAMSCVHHGFRRTKPALANLYRKYGEVSIKINDFAPSVEESRPTARKPTVVVEGKTLRVVADGDSNINVKLMNLLGKVAAERNTSGSAEISLADIPAGRYVAEVRSAWAWQSLPVVVK